MKSINSLMKVYKKQYKATNYSFEGNIPSFEEVTTRLEDKNTSF